MDTFNEKTFKPTATTDWYSLSYHKELSEEFISKYADKLNWYYICWYQKLSEDFIDKNAKNINWYNISCNQKIKLSEDFISKYANKLDWHNLCSKQKFSEEFLTKHQSKVSWHGIAAQKNLSEKFIEKFKTKLDWSTLCYTQKLSEAFMEKHINRLHWNNVCRYQELSEAFIKKHSDKVNYQFILSYQKNLSKEFKQKFIDDAFNDLKVGKEYSAYYSFPNSKSKNITVNGVKFIKVTSQNDPNSCFAISQKNNILVAKQCSNCPQKLETQLKKIIKEKTSVDEYKSFNDWVDFIPHKALKTLESYIGCGSSRIKSLDKKNKLDWFIEHVKKMPRFKTRDNKFYRGMRITDKSFFKKRVKGSIFEIDSLTSVSASKNIAKGFAGYSGNESVIMVIKANSVRHVASNVEEKEGFLLKGTKFLIKDIRKTKEHTEYILEEHICDNLKTSRKKKKSAKKALSKKL